MPYILQNTFDIFRSSNPMISKFAVYERISELTYYSKCREHFDYLLANVRGSSKADVDSEETLV